MQVRDGCHHDHEYHAAVTSVRSPHFRNLDLNLLKVFDVVMAERNVTRSASQLAMTQPAVSNALRRLREALGAELFVTGRQGVVPTAQALALWPAVRESLQRLQEALAPQSFDPHSRAHGFTLAMAEATGALLLPPLLQATTLPQTRVHLRVVALATRDPGPLLEQGQIDVALGFFPELRSLLAGQGDDALMRLEPLYESDYVAVMRRGHPLAREDALGLDAFCAAPHVRVSFAGRARGFADDALTPLQRQRRVVMTVSHFFPALRLVLASDLLTVLPRSFVQASGLAGQLAVRALPMGLPPIQTSLLWHRRHERDEAQAWLRDCVHRAAAEVAARLRRDAA
jgi:DNA-binding transcriptional LysR family regulator